MTILAHDDYNRADSTTIGAGDIGPVPTEYGVGVRIVSNELVASGSGRGALMYDTGVVDASTEVVVGSTPSITIGPMVRASNADNCWAFVALTTVAGIYSVVAGATFRRATFTPTLAPGDVLKLTAVGNVYTAHVNGVQVATYTDGSNYNATNTGQGVWFANNAGTITDVSVTSLATTSPHGTTTLAAAAALTDTGRKVAHGSASTVATSTLTSSGRKAGRGTTLLTSPAGLTASGHQVGAAHGTATLTLSGVLTAAGHKNGRGTTALSSHVTLTTSGHRVAHGTALLTSPATLTASGHAVEARHGLTTLTLTPSLTADGRKVAHGTTALALTATLTARGDNPANRHDITVTATLGPRRWAGALSGRDKTGTLSDRRWTGALT